MKTQTQKADETIKISREKLLSLVSRTFGGINYNPNPDEPHKPGPWDPVIRKVFTQMTRYGPSPDPWFSGSGLDQRRLRFNQYQGILEFLASRFPQIYDAIGGGQFFSQAAVEINPQPLPPRATFLAAFTQEVIDRVLLTQEIADAINQKGDQQGIIIVGGKISMLVDELCGNNFKIKIPIPRPKGDTDERLSALELLTAGAVFEQNAGTVANGNLRHELRNAGAKLIETGIARM